MKIQFDCYDTKSFLEELQKLINKYTADGVVYTTIVIDYQEFS